MSRRRRTEYLPLNAARGRRRRRLGGVLLVTVLAVAVAGPAASWLQSRHDWADPRSSWDAVYLAAGGMAAQADRIAALTDWVARRHPAAPLVVLVGNDPAISLWCRVHQANHTRVGWAVERLAGVLDCEQARGCIAPIIVPGRFSGTDGEMAALAAYLRLHPELTRVALVTSRFHARRLLCRARRHATGRSLTFAVVPGIPHWRNRAPWIVLGEYAKLFRDSLGLMRVPLLSRGPGKSET